MADTATHTSSRIRPDKADRILYHALVYLAATIHDDAETEDMLQLVRRAAPIAGNSNRTTALKRAADEIMIAAPTRRSRAGSVNWARAQILLGRVLCQDAKAQAVGALE